MRTGSNLKFLFLLAFPPLPPKDRGGRAEFACHIQLLIQLRDVIVIILLLHMDIYPSRAEGGLSSKAKVTRSIAD